MSAYSSVRSLRNNKANTKDSITFANDNLKEEKKVARKPIGQQKSIQDSINRMIKGRIKKEQAGNVRKQNLTHVPSCSSIRTSSRLHEKSENKRPSGERMVEIKMKFGDNFECVRFGLDDDLSLIAHKLTQRNNLNAETEQSVLEALKEMRAELTEGEQVIKVIGAAP
eukprot:TRINITY_DN5491_c0_g1_i3.p2 TRINITY_DN5491_c0_g1~~TRINITY_DN5491_c0_g1_i3.p2  ORF type:complete len:168 (-),score=32.73 TRINITY_DN5491_c0_g1_i3:95-598(-)